MRWGRGLALSALVLGVVALLGVRTWRAKDRGTVHRGWAVAESQGCFTCHGVGGHRGMSDPGHGLEDIPPWSGGLMSMYAENEAEIREWIQDGLTKRVRKDPEQMKLRQGAAIAMPSFRDVLSDADLDALVAYVKAVADFDKPEDAKAEAGRQIAIQYGCFNCHGPQGRGALDNPGSLKGYVPSWDGRDFPDLVRNRAEFDQWVMYGISNRFRENPAAGFFLHRAAVHMPPYLHHAGRGDLDALWAYVTWLRRTLH